ncbi:hypothetical protein JB92DRAFT_3213856 [Gautieria morchelliformis]|nr:hypothetical protein JB92DRAFT_3213856 [Gautieria morchelliformis]
MYLHKNNFTLLRHFVSGFIPDIYKRCLSFTANIPFIPDIYKCCLSFTANIPLPTLHDNEPASMPPSDSYSAGAPSGSPFHQHEPSSNGSISSDMSIFSQPQPIAHLSMEERIEQMRREPHSHQQSQSEYYIPQIDPSLDSLPYVDPEDDPSPPVAPRGNAVQLVAALKSRKKYTPNCAALLDSWAESQGDPLARELILLDAILQAIPDDHTSHAQYHIPKGLKAFLFSYGSFAITLTKYTNCIILSLKLTAYRGNIALAMLNMMRELNIHDLPAAQHEDRIQAVITEISTEATTAHNMVKKHVLESLVPTGKHRHISDLCHAMIKKSMTGLAMTTYTQVRMAFIRTVIRETGDAKDTWELIDKRLREWEEWNPTTEKFQEFVCSSHIPLAMKINYHLDQEDFPRSHTELAMRPVTLTKDLEKWQIVCDHHAGKAGTEKVGRKGRAY